MVRVGCAYPKWSNDDDERDAYCRWWDEFVAPLLVRGAVVYGYGPGCAVAMNPSGMYDNGIVHPSGPVWERVLDDLASADVGRRMGMGYANCGKDSKGRPIGYGFEAKCDHPGCDKVIWRGMGHACGGDHGSDEVSCEGYFCHEHLFSIFPDGDEGKTRWVCEKCKEARDDR